MLSHIIRKHFVSQVPRTSIRRYLSSRIGDIAPCLREVNQRLNRLTKSPFAASQYEL